MAQTGLRRTTEVGGERAGADAEEEERDGALDWLRARQRRSEKKRAARHLTEGARVLFDVSSSSYHGSHCPLAVRGYNRDGEKLPSIVYGLLADAEGRPVAIDVYPGNTADPKTIPDQVEKLRKRFGLERVVLVGDRGMLTQARIDDLRQYPNLGWISALRAPAVRRLVEQGDLQLSLFDKQNLAEIRSDLYHGERLVVCHNPLLAEDRRRTREELLRATEKKLAGIASQVKRRTRKPLGADEIGLKVGKILGARKMGKHFLLDIADSHFEFSRDREKIEAEAQLDGIYIIRSSEADASLSAPDTVRAYKSLGQVEQAFRCLKSVDLHIRPIHHRTEDHVRAHVFLAVLSYYVDWHMRRALAPVLFEDEELAAERWTRDPVAKAEPSAALREKKRKKTTPEGWPVHSFASLLADLSTRCRNTCRAGAGKNTLRFEQLTEPTPFQEHVFGLLGLKPSRSRTQ